MPHKIPRQAPASGTDGIIRVVLLYAVFASLWIVLSDKGVEWLFHDSAHIVLVSTLKGWLFVAVTSLLLYGLMRRLLGNMPTASTPSTGSWRWLRVSLALVLLAIVVVTAGSMVGGYRHEKDKEVARLEAISDLKASQIADWIKERDLDGHFVQSSRFFADRYRDWRDTGDSVSGDMLKQRLNEYRNDRLFHGVLLLDEQSEVLWNSEGTGEALSPDLQAAAAEAATAGRARRVGPYLDATGRPRLDIVAPLLLAGDHRRPVVVLRVDPAAYLFPTLRSWPVPSGSGETMLFRRDGGDVVFLNEHRHRKDAGVMLRCPLVGNRFLAAQVLQGVVQPGNVIEGVDHWGVPVMGVARAVPGTDWFLLAKMDQAEAHVEANRDALWIALTGLLAIFITVSGAFLFRQHGQLLFSLRESEIQAEKLRALQLLDAIAENSGDAIYAKDREGRYLFFNREAARLVAKSPQEVLGRDDTSIFAHEQAASVMANDRQVMEGNRIFTVQEDLTTAEGEITFLATKGPLHDAAGNVIGMVGVSHDITERKRAEEEIRESEHKYRVLFETANDGIFLLNETGVVDCNQKGADMCGRTREEMIGCSPMDFSPERQPDGQLSSELAAAKMAAALDGEPLRFEWESLRADGEPFAAELALNRVEMGGAVFLQAICRDITERKRAEEAVARERTFSEDIINSLPGIFYMYDDKGKLVRWNKKHEEATGYSSEEMLGRYVLDWFSEEHKQYILSQVQSVFAEGESFAEAPLSIKNGSQVPYFFTGRLAMLDGKQYLVGVGIDITARKRSEAERTLLATAIEQAEENVLVTDERRTILYINPAFERSSGYRFEDLKGQKLRVLRSAQHDEAFYRNMKDILDRGEVWMGVIINKGKDGTDFEIEGTISPLRDASGAITHLVAAGRNMSRFRKLERELYQAQKMESVGRLAGGVAHDFNNMLTAILGHAELAMMRCAPTEPVYADLKVIEKSAHRSADLIRQLLAFARKQTVAPKVLDVNDTVAGMLKILRRLIGEDIDLLWMPGAGLWPVKIDPSQIDQILANLCVNARDAIDGVGKVTIETENMAFDAAYCAVHPGVTLGEYVMLAVSDDGCGMPKEVLDHLFEPFFTTKEVGMGTGLGLATVYGIVKQNEGFISVYSEPERGTTLKIYLPRFAGEVVESIAASALETPKGSGETVLLVEDDGVILNVGQAILEGLGYRVLTAVTPGEALRQAEAHAAEIELLITDVVMPEMNGRDLSKLIRDIKPGLKCLFTSGYTANVIAHRGVLDEGVHFLQKPFSVKDMGFKVREVLESE